MKYLLLCLFPSIVLAADIKMPLDFDLQKVSLTDNTMVWGYQILPWGQWNKRPSAGPLQMKTNFDTNDLEVFEARAAGIVRRPISFFTAANLHTIQMIRKLNPQNTHQQLPGARFTIDTVVPFPKTWATLIAAAKTLSVLDNKTTDHIRMISEFELKTKKQIESSPALLNAVKSLNDRPGVLPEIMNLQGTTKVNQIADFITVVTLFYPVDQNRTLVVNHMAIALKRHLLRGIDTAGIKLSGRSILMGEADRLNEKDGIGAGLPIYSKEFFAGVLNGLEK